MWGDSLPAAPGDVPRPLRRSAGTSGAAAALVAVVALGFGLRAWDLTHESLWGDEIWSMSAARSPGVAGVVNALRLDVHPPLYFLLLHFWMSVFGESDLAVRSLSVLLGALALPVLYGVGVRIVGRRIAGWATLFAALSPWQIRYSQDARPYALVLLLSALSMYFFLGILRDPRRRNRAGWLVSTALLLYTHAYAVWLPLAQNLFVVAQVLRRRRSPRIRPWLLAQAGLAALYAPWVPALLEQAARYQATPERRQPPGFLKPFESLSHFAGSDATLVVFGIVLSVGFWRILRRRGPSKDSLLLLALWLLVPILVPWVISRLSSPLYVTRAAMPAALAWVLLCGAAVVSTRRRRVLHVVVVTATVLASCVEVARNHWIVKNDQWREATASVEASARPGDGLWTVSPVYRDAVEHYRRRSDLAVHLHGGTGVAPPTADTPVPPVVWLFLHDYDEPEAVASARRSLEADGHRREEARSFLKVTVEKYRR